VYNLLILGSGRSGTSMASALFRNAGYFFGDELHARSLANQYGYYEDVTINRVNSQLITRMLFWRTMRPIFGWAMPPVHRDFRALWLASPRHLLPRRLPAELEATIKDLVSHAPFCYKDPRFSLTLPIWRPYLPKDTRFLVVFRDPDRTAASVMRDAKETYDPPLPVSLSWAYEQWGRNYHRLLKKMADDTNWFFADYDDIISGASIAAIEAFTHAKLDTSEIDPSVSRSKRNNGRSALPAARKCWKIYDVLRSRAAQDAQRYNT
jgi:hypothetical protein